MSAVSSVVQVSGPASPVIGQYVKVQNWLKSWINMSLLYLLNWNGKCILVKLS